MQPGASEYCSATAQARERPLPGPALGFIRTWTLGVTVTPDGQVRLLDYGIAQTADRAGAARAGLLILDQPGRASSCCLGVPRSAHTRIRQKVRRDRRDRTIVVLLGGGNSAIPLLLYGPEQHQTVHAPPGRPSHSCETQWHQGQVRRHGDRRIVDELQFWQAGRQRRAGGARVKVMMVAGPPSALS